MASKLKLNRELVDLKDTVGSSISGAKGKLSPGVVMHSRLTDAKVPVWGDAVSLQQISDHIVDNAVRFTPVGTIEVRLSKTDAAVLTVTDSGLGIERAQLEQIFEGVASSGYLASENCDFSGILSQCETLSWVRQLVQAHDGEISAYSEGLGFGASFTVRLPLASEGCLTESSDLRRRSALSGLRVLIVDDETESLDVTKHVLEAAAAEVVTARSASHALQLLRRPLNCDVLVSDIGLPDRDGLSLLREIRQRDFTPQELPAIALTGFSGAQDASMAKAAGFQMHLAKPVDAQVLVQAIVCVLEKGNELAHPTSSPAWL